MHADKVYADAMAELEAARSPRDLERFLEGCEAVLASLREAVLAMPFSPAMPSGGRLPEAWAVMGDGLAAAILEAKDAVRIAKAPEVIR